MLKIASWNVNSLRIRLPQVLQWLESASPDVLGLQETKLQDRDFPAEALEAAGYRVAFSGQKTYNGVALLSRLPMEDLTTGFAGCDDPQRRVLAATIGNVRVYNLYVPNGQEVGSDKYRYKLDWLTRLRDQISAEQESHPNVLLMGDFNIAPEDRDVHDPEAWAGKILCSEPERAALGKLRELGLHDTFRLFEQPESCFSWWDYRAAGFRRDLGLRIDLLLASETLCKQCVRSVIDKEPRRWERPSDHAPVFAEFSDCRRAPT